MAQLKANDVISAFLGPIKERTEILDDFGTFLGYFVPASDQEEALYRHAASLFDPVDADASRVAEGPGSPIGDVLQRLRRSGSD